MDYILGFDIGGTKSAAILASAAEGIQIIDKMLVPTEASLGFVQAKNKLFDMGRSILYKNNMTTNDLTAIGISCGGPLHEGVIYSPPHLPGWDNIPIAEIISKEFGVPAFLQNDANACALVEWQLGAGKGCRDMVFITMGTGFGAGIIAESKLIQGTFGQAGEIGHLRLSDDINAPYGYGKQGSVEAYCSGEGIANLARIYTEESLAKGIKPAWVKDGLNLIDAEKLAKYAHDGDKDACLIFEKVGEYLGKALSVLIDLLNPEVIVIGSIFVRCENLLRPSMEKTLTEESLTISKKACRIVPAKLAEHLGDYASIYAACYAAGIDMSQKAQMSTGAKKHFERLFERNPYLSIIRDDLLKSFELLSKSFKNGGKLLICGNGGSASDAEHIAGELMKGFYLPRNVSCPKLAKIGKFQGTLPAIALTQHTSLSTAIMNDTDPAMIYAQQVYGYGKAGDVLLAISTSGNAENVCKAAETAKVLGIKTIAMTGQSGGRLASICNILLCVPASTPADVQEMHLPIYHTLCAMVEEEFFG